MTQPDMTQLELHRPVPMERVGVRGLDVIVEASPEECAALAERMDLPGIASLTCQFRLTPLGATRVVASGRLHAEVTQTCVVTAEDFPTTVDEVFQVRFVPAEEIMDELDLDEDDEIPFENGILDLGEAAAEQLGLALDPYPRMPGAELPEPEESDDDNPFTALQRMRRVN